MRNEIVVEAYKARKRRRREDNYVLGGMFPQRGVSIVAGTRPEVVRAWLRVFVERWERGEVVEGYQSYPQKWAFIAADDNAGRRLKFPNRFDILGRHGAESLAENLRSLVPSGVRVFFVDSIYNHVPGSRFKNYQAVRDFLCELGAFCEECDVTVIGTMRAWAGGRSKLYPRERVMGSVTWASCSEGMVHVEPERTLWLPRHQRAQWTATRDLLVVDDETAWQAMMSAMSDEDARIKACEGIF